MQMAYYGKYFSPFSRATIDGLLADVDSFRRKVDESESCWAWGELAL